MSDAFLGDPTGPGRPYGPFYVPRIECGKCGTEHHIDAASGEYQGRCRGCAGYLRRPTDEEEREFWNFLDWQIRHDERDGVGA